jgi:tryptophanyl-tRNA synthetase
MNQKKRLFTGLQPSGTLHIGNYFGALKPFADMYSEYESHLMIADYHSLTTMRDGELLRSNIIDVVKDYMAVGVDTEEVIIFKQSDVQEHTELAWIFECLVTVPFLSQAHAYKDKVAKGLEANAGLFNYPMLMASDILLYDADVVPVGEDQRQHVEYAREAVTKFNNAYGETFTAPQEMVLKGVGIIPGTDGQKMSKSYKNTIPLFGTKDEITKAVMSIVTQSSIGMPTNVYNIHDTVYSFGLEGNNHDEFYKLYSENENNYKHLKECLIEDLEKMIAPMREKRAQITEADVRDVLAKGSARAREQASRKMTEVRKKIGVSL